MENKPAVITDLDAEVDLQGELVSIRSLVDTIAQASEMVDEIQSLRDFKESTRIFLERDSSELRVITSAVQVWRDLGWDSARIDRAASDLLAELKGRDPESDPEEDAPNT